MKCQTILSWLLVSHAQIQSIIGHWALTMGLMAIVGSTLGGAGAGAVASAAATAAGYAAEDATIAATVSRGAKIGGVFGVTGGVIGDRIYDEQMGIATVNQQLDQFGDDLDKLNAQT